ncbi:MAG: serine/threonine-protein kinase [Deltaproteobacteria bacterium]
MRKPHAPVSHEVLVEEARFILRTLQRDDLFGDRVRLTEAERVLSSSISLPFKDYCDFLNKFGYVREDRLNHTVEVTEGGNLVAQDLDDAEFHARLSRHFARELSGSSARPLPRGDNGSAVEPAPSLVPGGRTRPSIVREAPAAMDDVLDRRYRRGDPIGSGTIGTVFSGQHVSLGRKMAIKEARSIFQFASYLRRDEIVRRLRSTVETHASLVHPNIIQVIDQNPEREFPYFVMELAEGGNLRQRLEASDDGRLELSAAIRILLQLSYALDYAHQQGVFHVGLKPENVLFDGLGNVKLSDFAMARITDRDDADGQTPVLVSGSAVGYSAPERLQPGASQEPTASADIYALGMLFYEMITGKLPGRRSPLPSQARKEVPSAFDDVFDKMTRDELDERYTAIEQVLEGVYKAFPTKEVFSQGTILQWAKDPNPLPAPPAPVEPPKVEADASDLVTGEIEVEEAEKIRTTVAAPAKKKRPPPPPK